jgi:hypothetical protein
MPGGRNGDVETRQLQSARVKRAAFCFSSQEADPVTHKGFVF